MTLTLRPATPQDAPALTRIYAEAARVNAADRAFLDANPDLLQVTPDQIAHCMVAECAGTPVGFLRMGEGAEIAGLFVAPAAQGRGVGRALLSATPARAWCLANPAALGFWQACGFTQTGQAETPGGPAIRVDRNATKGEAA